MKTLLQLALVLVLASGWLPAAAQGDTPVDVPEPNLVVDTSAIDNSEPYAQELLGQVFLPALSTDHDGANAMASSAVDAGTVATVGARTADTRYNTRNYFYPGQSLKYIGMVGNTTGAARTATLAWRLTGPCDAGTLWTGSRIVVAGTMQWILDRSTPACAGDYVFTFKVTYGGVTTSRTSNFSVIALDGAIRLGYVRTIDSNRNIRSTFRRSEMIGFISEIINETTEPLAVELWYRLTTKCYPESVLTYRTIEVPPGKKMFDHWGKISDCTGSARFTVEIRYHNEDYRGGRDLNVLH